MLKKLGIIVLLGTLVLSTSALADARSDYELAMKNAQENKVEEGVKLLESVSKSTDKVYMTKANYRLGIYYLSMKDTAKSKEYFNKAIKDKKDSSVEVLDSLSYLANIYYSEKNIDQAEKIVLDSITRTQGKNATVLAYAGAFYFTGKPDYIKSEEYFKKASILEPKNLKYKINLIQLYEKKNDQNAVTKELAEIKAINDKITTRDFGIYFAEYGNVELANKYLLKAVNEDKDKDAILNLGIFYYNIGKKDEGKQLVTQAESLGIKGAAEAMQQIKTVEASTTTK